MMAAIYTGAPTLTLDAAPRRVVPGCSGVVLVVGEVGEEPEAVPMVELVYGREEDTRVDLPYGSGLAEGWPYGSPEAPPVTEVRVVAWDG